MRAVSQEIPQPLTTKISLKITHLKFTLNLPGVNDLRFPLTIIDSDDVRVTQDGALATHDWQLAVVEVKVMFTEEHVGVVLRAVSWYHPAMRRRPEIS